MEELGITNVDIGKNPDGTSAIFYRFSLFFDCFLTVCFDCFATLLRLIFGLLSMNSKCGHHECQESEG